MIEPKNLAASIRERLRQRAATDRRPFDEVLTYYAIERFLFRLSKTSHRDRFVLKGALMLPLWGMSIARATRDIDLLGRGDPTPAEIASMIADCIAVAVHPDAVAFDPASIETSEIREQERYGGTRATFLAYLERARIKMQVDVGLGDVVTPGVVAITYPALLELPAPELAGYPVETTIAEKLEAIVDLGLANSRMKDSSISGTCSPTSSSMARWSRRRSARRSLAAAPRSRIWDRSGSHPSSRPTATSSRNGQPSRAACASPPHPRWPWSLLGSRTSLRHCSRRRARRRWLPVAGHLNGDGKQGLSYVANRNPTVDPADLPVLRAVVGGAASNHRSRRSFDSTVAEPVAATTSTSGTGFDAAKRVHGSRPEARSGSAEQDGDPEVGRWSSARPRGPNGEDAYVTTYAWPRPDGAPAMVLQSSRAAQVVLPSIIR